MLVFANGFLLFNLNAVKLFMDIDEKDLYANLPDDLLEEIINDAPKITNKLKPLFEQSEDKRNELHEKLTKNSLEYI
jgi:hypothetical protein